MSKIVVADADALIALSLEQDPHHNKAVAINRKLMKQETVIIFPVTVFPEVVTTLKRAFNQPKKAHFINKQYLEGNFQVEYINEEIMKKAAEIFDKKAISKQNTLFDAIVAATAEKLEADTIFSFDNWYSKLGFTLAD
ncbi:PIN domain-containing protein [Candidatus Daviesbacteria bacterium]|nr:PIN domain-containing protein [Candidatus Daviesbacteria bacterium]